MEKLTNVEVAQGFRRLAEMLESDPNMEQPYEGTGGVLLFMSHEKDKFVATVKAFGGGKKGSDEGSLTFVPDAFPLRVKVLGFKERICERKIITRVVPKTVIPAKPASDEIVIPEHEETTVEYVCDPAFLRVQADSAPVEG